MEETSLFFTYTCNMFPVFCFECIYDQDKPEKRDENNKDEIMNPVAKMNALMLTSDILL